MEVTVDDHVRLSYSDGRSYLQIKSNEDIINVLYTAAGVASVGAMVIGGDLMNDPVYIYKVWVDKKHVPDAVLADLRQILADCVVVENLLKDVDFDTA